MVSWSKPLELKCFPMPSSLPASLSNFWIALLEDRLVFVCLLYYSRSCNKKIKHDVVHNIGQISDKLGFGKLMCPVAHINLNNTLVQKYYITGCLKIFHLHCKLLIIKIPENHDILAKYSKIYKKIPHKLQLKSS